MSPVLGRPSRAPRSRPVNPGAKAPGLGKDTMASGKTTGEPRATQPDEARRTRQCHEGRRRGTPPATTKAHRQVPSNNGRRVPQTRTARTTRSQPHHENRYQATPAAIWKDVCAPGSVPSPCRLRNRRHPDERVRVLRVPRPCRLQNSLRPDGRVRAQRVPSPCWLRNAAVRMDGCVPRSDASHTQHRRGKTQQNTLSEHTAEPEPSGRGHRTRNTTGGANTPVKRSQAVHDTAHARQRAERAHR